MHNVKTGGKHSKKEYMRGIQLEAMQKDGVISNLRSQIHFVLQESFEYAGNRERKISYVADYVYNDSEGRLIVEDVKGWKTDVYRIKRKMLLFRYPYIIFLET